MSSLKDDVKNVITMMDELINDTTIPRNIRANITQAKEKIEVSKDNKELEVNIAQAIYLLDDALNDINLPFHVRPDMMAVISELEAIKEKIK